MLGRQQIAGIPTAISELFKNAHDAYAKNVEVDYYRARRLLVLRDDGVGMTRSDFEERWLTIGTESKLGTNSGISLPPRDEDQGVRPVMGEKGIGRLAIAAIGRQVLVMTRARNPSIEDHLVIAFIHWGLFSLPRVDLADIRIPLRVFSGGSLPSDTDVAELVGEVRANLSAVTEINQSERVIADALTIESELAAFAIDPRQIESMLPDGPRLDGNGHGTHFIILPTEETLDSDIDGAREDDVASPLKKVLVGFTNTMTRDESAVAIVARFRDHQTDGTVSELLSGDAFFSQQEFAEADHHIEGTFDVFGHFRGSVSVYGSPPVECSIPSLAATGDPVDCGAFSIKFAYIQGEGRKSKLSPEEHGRMVAKLNKIGGLYIYRDGIRILPYGNSDYDFLNIERRRTKSASYYFFSYRRMFGVIDVTRRDNPRLEEKAGREGFRENKAYRQMKQILESFLIQLSADYFREGGTEADLFFEINQQLERNEQIRRKRSNETRVRRAILTARLEAFFSTVNNREPETAADLIIANTSEQLNSALSVAATRDSSGLILDAEARASRSLHELSEQYRISKPRGVGLSRDVRRDWEAYLVERARLEKDVFDRSRRILSDEIASVSRRFDVILDRRRHLERKLSDTISRERARARLLQRETTSELKPVQERVRALTRSGLSSLENTMRNAMIEFGSTNLAVLDEIALDEFRQILERRINEVANRETENFERLREQLRSVATEEGFEQVDVTEALEEELEELQRKEFEDMQLAQIGMALGIVQHEFASSVNTVRTSLRLLKPWADANEKLDPLYRQLRTSFDHLDGYLTLFTPLDRRLQRKRVTVKGSEIARFLENLFQDRFNRHSVRLVITQSFRKHSVVEFPSTLYPCFVNLVDNSIFWLDQRPADQRVITLDATKEAWIISDTGPGIRSRDAKAVFESGFTRKPGGRGLGLHISREILRRSALDLTLDPYVEGKGATFRIQKPENDSESAEPLAEDVFEEIESK